MNAINYRYSILKEKVIHRIIVLLLMITMIIPLLYIPEQFSTIQSILLGLCTSIIAWAVVDYLELSVNTYAIYIDERHQFLAEIRKQFEAIKKLFQFEATSKINQDTFQCIDDMLSLKDSAYQKEIKDTWMSVDKLFTDIYNFIILYPLKSQIYCCSAEYEELQNYFNRCYWLLQGCLYAYPNNLATLYEKFIDKKVKSSPYVIEKLDEWNTINKKINSCYITMQSIELNTKSYTPPNDIIEKYKYSIIHYYSDVNFNITSSQAREGYFIFCPYKTLEKYLYADQENSICKQYFFLIFTLIDKKLPALHNINIQ